jgi:hypothetical protein
MGNINVSRVLLGGLAAGVVLNVLGIVYQLVFADNMEAEFARLGLEVPGGSLIAIFMLLGLVSGIVLIWLYAAIRPRFGAGPATAIKAAVPVWFFGSLSPAIFFALLGLFPAGAMTVGAIFDLVAYCVSAVVGAMVYQEGSSGSG